MNPSTNTEVGLEFGEFFGFLIGNLYRSPSLLYMALERNPRVAERALELV